MHHEKMNATEEHNGQTRNWLCISLVDGALNIISIYHSMYFIRTKARVTSRFFVWLGYETIFHNVLLVGYYCKPIIVVVERSVFSLHQVIVRPTNIINRVEKIWAHLKKIKYFKDQHINTWSPSPIFFIAICFRKDLINFQR